MCRFFRIIAIAVILHLDISSIWAQSRLQSYDTIYSKTNDSDTLIQRTKRLTDSLILIYSDSNYQEGRRLFTPRYFDIFFSKYFSYMSTSKAGLPNGNSVSIQPSSNSTRLQVNLAHQSRGIIYNAGLQADYTDNIAKLITGKDINSNTTFYANVSFLRSGDRMVYYDANAARNNNRKKIYTLRQFQSNFAAKFGIEYAKDSAKYVKAKLTLDSLLGIPNSNTVAQRIIEQQDELNKALVKLDSYRLNDNPGMYQTNGMIDELSDNVQDSLLTILDTIEVGNSAWNAFKFSWFSAGLTYNRQLYNTYDSNLVFAQRIGRSTFNNVALSLSYNWIWQRSAPFVRRNGLTRESFFLNASYSIANDHSYGHLNDGDLLVLRQRFSNDTIYQFQTTSKLRDISGQSGNIDWLHNFAFQFTTIFGQSGFMGVNFGGNTSFGRLTRPIYNGRIGLLMRFINSDDQKSKLNFEVFLQLPDWADASDNSSSTWERKIIGFNATIPFSKLFF